MIVLYFTWPKDTLNTRGAHLVNVTLGQVDFIGAILLLIFTTSFTFSIQEGGSRAYAWDSPVIIALLVITVVAFVALMAWSFALDRVKRFASVAEILPWRILTDRVLVSAIIRAVWYEDYIVYIEFAAHKLTSCAGIHLLPTVIAVAIGAAIGGLISMQKNFTFYTILAGNALILIGAGIYSVTPISLKVPHVLYGSQVIAGLGCGLTFCCTTMIISLTAEFQDHALGQGLVAQARIVGGTLGVAMSTAVFGNRISSLTDVLTAQQISTLYRNTGFISQLSLAQQVAVRQAFALAFNDALRICTYVSAVSLVVSFFTWQKHPPSIQERKDQLEAAMLNVPETSNADFEMASQSHSTAALEPTTDTGSEWRTVRQSS
nr:efflux pump mlce [Quercus suber]